MTTTLVICVLGSQGQGHFIKATSLLNNLQGKIASPSEMMSSSTAVEQLMYNYN